MYNWFKVQWAKLYGWLRSLVSSRQDDEEYEIDVVQPKIDVPKEYLDKFLLRPLTSDEELTDRQQEIEYLNRSYDNWQVNQQPLLMIRQPGEGLTSILNHITAKWDNVIHMPNDQRLASKKRVLEVLASALNVASCESLDQLLSALPPDQNYKIIFENVERLFLRKVGGFGQLEDFILMMKHSRHRFFWVLTVSKFSFSFLERAIGLSSYFVTTLHLKPLSNETLLKIINDRNGDYKPVYLTPESIPVMVKRQLKNADKVKRQEILKAHFEKQMFGFSNGNISRALLFWTHSLVTLFGEKVYVRAMSPSNIEGLSLDDLFVLESIMQHFTLSLPELKSVIRNIQSNKNLTLEQLQEKGLVKLVEYQSGEKEYRLSLLYIYELNRLFHSRLNRNVS